MFRRKLLYSSFSSEEDAVRVGTAGTSKVLNSAGGVPLDLFVGSMWTGEVSEGYGIQFVGSTSL